MTQDEWLKKVETIIYETVWVMGEVHDGVKCKVYHGIDEAALAILALGPPAEEISSSGAESAAQGTAALCPARRDAKSRLKREQGPVEVLCREIGFPWDQRLERTDLFVAFVRELVASVGEQRHIQEVAQQMGGKPPTEGSTQVLRLAEVMLSVSGRSALIGGAALVHEAARRLNPEDAYPTDHLIDMLSSCASAIRFGLEEDRGYGSRHAAEAAQHIWQHLYGIHRVDSYTMAWEKDWARQKLVSALISLLPAESPCLSGFHP